MAKLFVPDPDQLAQKLASSSVAQDEVDTPLGSPLRITAEAWLSSTRFQAFQVERVERWICGES